MRVILGQSARRFLSSDSSKPLVLAGLIIPGELGLMDDSDGDVVLQALCQIIGSLQGYQKFKQISSDLLEKDAITDSVVLLEHCLAKNRGLKISQVSFSIEAKSAFLLDYLDRMQSNMAHLLKISKDRVMIIPYDSNGLSDVSCGDGISVLCAITLEN
jgi:2-C-methyl-D-erythritol 2,4-cyclodiphosphate synthase